MIFKDSVILLTGASAGIGYQLAIDLAKEGAKLALVARRKNLIDDLIQKLPQKSVVKPYQCDVTQKNQVAKVVKDVKDEFGKIDVAILNAGVAFRASVLDYNSEAAEITFNTNVLGQVYFIERLLPDFIKSQSGVIVGISSLGDGKGFPKSGFYSASKAALTILLESLRIELKKYNVKVITVKPGFIKTAMTDKNEFEMPFLMSAEKASQIILTGLKKEKRMIEFPMQTALSAKFLRMIPTRWFESIASRELPKKN